MNDTDRVQRLIEKGQEVLATHHPNPPGVIGFSTLDSKAFSAWYSQCLNFLESRLPPSSPYTRNFKEQVPDGYTGSVQSGIGILDSVKEDLEASAIHGEQLIDKPATMIRKLCDRFHLVCRQIRDRHGTRPTIDVQDEYDVQDLFHALLHIGCDDIRPEEWTPSYAGSCSRMDFLLKQEQVVVEIKKTRSGLGAKELGSQLIEDIARYRTHPDCKMLICFIYDPDGRINNPRGIENDLNQADRGLPVEVLIRP
jgi:hypothetical protein